MNWAIIAIIAVLSLFLLLCLLVGGAELILHGKVKPSTARGLAVLGLLAVVLVLAILAVWGLIAMAQS